jgi:hypothetical protein
MRDLTHPTIVLRVDGLAVAAIAVLLYHELGASWWIFALGFLAPDLAFFAYLAGPRAGAAVYNAIHTYVGSVAAFGIGLAVESSPLMMAGLIWTAHIGLDRAAGFGLKYPDAFRRTHLQRL